MNTNWTGIELSGTTTWLNSTHPSTSAKDSRKLIKHLATCISSQSCTTYEVTIGFWVPTREWPFRLEAKKPHPSTTPPQEPKAGSDNCPDWTTPIRSKFTSYAGSGLVKERSIHAGHFADWKDWIDNVEDSSRWMHYTQFAVYLGVPFVEVKDGCLVGGDIMDLADLRVDHLREIDVAMVGDRGKGRKDVQCLIT